MARALRIERSSGRYHVTARGNERKDIFRDETDRFHFLELLGELSEHFGVRVHAYVLMDNHYHLLLETPEANLSRAMHWVNAGYCIWFNCRHQRHGHLLQGRFGAFVVEDDAGWQEVARYVHLNPVRMAQFELNKPARAASRVGLVSGPTPELVAERLRILREFRWSSYPGYAGYKPPLPWVWREPLARLCGGTSPDEQTTALRAYTERPLLQGALEPPWSRVLNGIVLGSAAFAQRLRREARERKGVVGKGEHWGRISTIDTGEHWGRISTIDTGNCGTCGTSVCSCPQDSTFSTVSLLQLLLCAFAFPCQPAPPGFVLPLALD